MSYQTSIKTLAELKAKAPATASFTIEQLWPDMYQVERKFIRPAISAALFDDLMTKYQANTPFSAAEMALWDRVQATSSALAMWSYAPKLNTQISSAGLHTSSTAQKKQAWEWQVRDLRNALKKQGMQSLDELVEYLIENETDYPLWLSSTERSVFYSHFVQEVKQFERFVNIGNSVFLFRKMFQKMNYVEKFRIENIISPELSTEIRTQTAVGTLTVPNAALLDYIKGAVSHITMADSINDLSLVMDDENIYSMDFNRTATVITPKPADLVQRAKLIDEQRLMGDTYLSMIKKLLAYDPETNYPTYFSSSTYSATMATKPYENESGSPIYVL